VLTSAPDTRRHTVHRSLPALPSTLYGHPVLLGIVGAVLLFLATGAVLSSGALLLTWDRPVSEWVTANRTSDLDQVFRAMSRFGATMTVVAVAPVLAAVAWARCRALALTIIVATLARPPLEFTLKELVGRERPDISRMVDGVGHSFPSGHPMAAAALWGLLPVVVSLYTVRRQVWWASVALSATMIALIGASRVYLGVHWLSDVVAGILVGGLFLLGVEWVYHRLHRRRPCSHAAPVEPEGCRA
jgi:undecaprenyl-diphosphatase